MGGHSLLATQEIAKLSAAFQRDLALRVLFGAPTVLTLAATIAALLREASASMVPAIRPFERTGKLPLSFAQQRLWLLDQFEPGSAIYNMPIAIRLTGTLDVPALAATFNEIVRRHEVLRTNLDSLGGIPEQVIAPALQLALAVQDLSAMQAQEKEGAARDLAAREAQTPFDLCQRPFDPGGLDEDG